MTEALFYHLERQALENVLPQLLERTRARGWRAIVQAGSPERVEALDTWLWTYSDDSFLAHGTAKDGPPEHQPIFLTDGTGNPNAATVRFLVDGAEIDNFLAYERLVYIFDGGDPEAVAKARQQWSAAKAAGVMVTYWQQDEADRWHKKA